METIIKEHDVQELELYAENTFEIYDGITRSVIGTLSRKYKRGIYEHTKAIKLWSCVADEAAKLYWENFCGHYDPWYKVFNKPTRREVAERLEEFYFDEVSKT